MTGTGFSTSFPNPGGALCALQIRDSQWQICYWCWPSCGHRALGLWRLEFGAFGTSSYVNPSTEDGHRELFMNYQNARRVANMAVEKQPLGSSTLCCCNLLSFIVGKGGHPSLPCLSKPTALLLSVERLIDNAKELNTP